MASQRVLILYHSFTGQTQRGVFKVKDALEAAGHSVDVRRIRPEKPWRRPIPRTTFLWRNALDWLGFDMRMPIRPLDLDPAAYDHIVLGTQTWHLGPAYPVLTFLTSEDAELFRGKGVSLLLTCRNRYKMVVDTIEEKISARGGRLGPVFVLCNKPDHMRPTLYYIFNDRDPRPGDGMYGKTIRPFPYSEEEMDHAGVWGASLATDLAKGTLPSARQMTVINDPG